MAKTIAPHPEPTTGTRYDSFLAPRSKTPAKDALYGALFNAGWRFDAHLMHWHTPEGQTFQAFGRLEYDPDLTWAFVQPPNPPGSMQRPTPIARLWRSTLSNEWHLEVTNA